MEHGAERNAQASLKPAVEETLLDKLKNCRAVFETNKTSEGPGIDAAYYRRFTILVKSFETLPDHLQADRTLLMEAGRRQDARTILEALPAFCENIAAMQQKIINNAEKENKMMDEILQRLKKALLDGDNNTAGKTITELGAANLTPTGCKLYFELYDLLMDDNIEEALEILNSHCVS